DYYCQAYDSSSVLI
nr:immunoglobulin light chain junction region [Macaca mulatta]MOW06260.1 immunoglobulin light chain junction region [Macaca mulatta]MOW07035.1 immunoglobulin light chain junction region [Macaca mulatta]